MLAVKNMHINLNHFYLENISFHVDKGDRCAFVGPSGAGKSILLEGMAGFHPLVNGGIFLDGKRIDLLSPEDRNITVVYQDNMLFPHFSVYGNIAFGLKKRTKREIREKVESISRELKIEHLLSRSPDTLSGGETQRAALARALVVRPGLLLMDEPFSALDPQISSEIRELMDKLTRRENTTVVYNTHNREDLDCFANKVGLIQNGRLLEFGAANEIIKSPKHAYLEKFVQGLDKSGNGSRY